ncbi:MAG: hypothetical protein AAFX94_13170 [Myxococcota bacterium]
MKGWVQYAPLLAPLAPVLLLLGAIFGGGRTPSASALLAAEPAFGTTDASEMYFKNIRSSHYERRPGPSEGYELFYLRGLKDASFEPFIVKHWMADRAYVMYTPDRGPDAVRIDGELIELARDRPEQAFKTTMTLCAAFKRGATVTAGDTDLSANKRHTRLFLRLCRDYLELIEQF